MKPTLALTAALLASTHLFAQSGYRWEDGAVRSTGRNEQVESGGPLAGAEFHGSRPLPSRISLFSPVANSIDLSTDYWKRGESRPLLLGIAVDNGPRRWLGKEPWEHLVAPNRTAFEGSDGDLAASIRYRFGSRDVAASISIDLKNAGSSPHEVELYAHLILVLRSCQSYARIPAARVRYDPREKAAVASFDDPRTARASLFVRNAGLDPASWTADGSALAVQDTGWSNWIEGKGELAQASFPSANARVPVAAFTYRATLAPGESMSVVLLIGSTSAKHLSASLARAGKQWRSDLSAYEAEVTRAMRGNDGFHSTDAWTDSSVVYSRAILAANRHELDGTVVPMPCPAEYNFFFTHDVLLTDLSAVFFDPGRVKRDLLYLLEHCRNNDLPHAYYWKDDGFKTEYAEAANWNNLWVILTSAAYLRHTSDTVTLGKLYPVLSRSLQKTLTMQSGNVLQGNMPDWWDFGKAPGSRAYLTILTIRAIEEYVYLSARLKKNLPLLAGYEQRAGLLRTGLKTLWDPEVSYLLNTIPQGTDRHVYMGPLLAAVYDQVSPERARRIVATAGRYLLDSSLGIRTVAPADFHTDAVKQQYGVKENEAGDPYLYANGGIWYLGNAWYALALRATNDIEGAFDFYRHTMTVDGILRSPSGQPGLYEYRYADPAASDRGRIDKPTMMWSAGFCIGTAYHMAGVSDNAWNITVGQSAPAALQNMNAALTFGNVQRLTRTGKGPMVTRLAVDGREIPSRILPLDAMGGTTIEVEMGPIRYPFVDSVNAVLRSASFDPPARSMTVSLSSYEGHHTELRIISPMAPRSVSLNGKTPMWGIASTPVGTIVVTVDYIATAGNDAVSIQF
jgi:hypothetical protein